MLNSTVCSPLAVQIMKDLVLLALKPCALARVAYVTLLAQQVATAYDLQACDYLDASLPWITQF